MNRPQPRREGTGWSRPISISTPDRGNPTTSLSTSSRVGAALICRIYDHASDLFFHMTQPSLQTNLNHSTVDRVGSHGLSFRLTSKHYGRLPTQPMENDRVFRALSDPTRREILRRLSRGELSAGKLAEHFATGRPTLSHHLLVLRDAGLVRSRRAGQRVLYALDATVADDLVTWVLSLFGPSTPNSVKLSDDNRG